MARLVTQERPWFTLPMQFIVLVGAAVVGSAAVLWLAPPAPPLPAEVVPYTMEWPLVLPLERDR